MKNYTDNVLIEMNVFCLSEACDWLVNSPGYKCCKGIPKPNFSRTYFSDAGVIGEWKNRNLV